VVAHTIAEERDMLGKNLAFSHFFSRRNQNRNDMTKFFPTFAYQLARLLPSVQQLMQKVLELDNHSIFDKRFRDQFAHLIVQPVLSATEPTSPMIIVVDGLDEYDPDQGYFPLEHLIQLLVQDLPMPPFRLLFTSRPETHIEAVFSLPQIFSSTLRVALQDFPDGNNVSNYLHQHLLEVWTRRKLPRNWLTGEDLVCLARKSDNMWIYASTLVKFIDDEYSDPQHKLKIALNARNGLDSLCEQVLDDAQKYRHFDLVLGAVIFIRGPPEICVFPSLLRLTSVHDVRLALRGCLSILLVPDDDDDYVRPHHASLLGFLTDPNRGRDHFIDPVKCNGAILNGCIQLITANLEGHAKSLHYACKNWCYHLHMMLAHVKDDGDIKWNFSFGVENFLKDVFQWFKDWMLGCGDDIAVERARNDLYSACGMVGKAMLM
jgi:hypothetical protein